MSKVGQRLSALASVGVPLVYFAMFCVYGLGVYRSFDRRGVGDGVASLIVPPWGFYRGIATIWEPPKWKDDYSSSCEAIALVLLADVSNDARKAELVGLESGLKKYVATLPQQETAKLRKASDGLVTGIGPLTRLQVAETAKADSAAFRTELMAAESLLSPIPEYNKQYNS